LFSQQEAIMRNPIHALAAFLAPVPFVLLSCAALAQQPAKVDFGKVEFESKCATCHGVDGKGNGPTAAFLTRKAADLTILAKTNGGVLPVSTMYDVIMGDKTTPAHGSRDMPAWGRGYRIQAGEFFVDVPYDPEAYVRVRVLSLIEYISRLQQK
jgi:mono/diheme cytochrome c family protein